MAEHVITVEVVYAGVQRSWLKRLALAPGSTVMDAVEASGVRNVLPPGETVDPARLAIFSRRAEAGQILRDGDRVEVCRPLVIDPKEARRRRASC